uniref:Uncharacterized protein n=1 Tax=mine drainage metagenome TaxID=410659 RepID=E6QDV3_9ZZZZ
MPLALRNAWTTSAYFQPAFRFSCYFYPINAFIFLIRTSGYVMTLTNVDLIPAVLP